MTVAKKCMVVLQHGSHGTHLDLACLSQYLKAKDPRLIVWESYKNEGMRTDDGVVPCGERLADNLIREIKELCSTPTQSGGDGGREKVVVQMSFVCHSMGGLIVREALPRVWDKVESQKGKLEIEWNMFCTIATPHGGVCQMASTLRYYLGRLISFFYSTSYHDMFLGSDVLTDRLLSPKHLSCLAAFKRRLLVSSINDILVPLMSSGFMLTPSQRGLAGDMLREEQKQLCAFNEREMYDKMRTITEIPKEEWPANKFLAERRIAKTLVQAVGNFDSVVVDLRSPRLEELYEDRKRRTTAWYGANKRSHQAMVCKPPFDTVEEAFGFVSHMVGDEVLATFQE
ncbi:Putative serine esterase (DUF676), putative [Trypanosoma equiperdum]|uniref:Serine esterase (DUF676), putative n=1 Tax=Trypanosoma equiperdum TaxID=5694 RepID=A0A1G4IJ96_TRYEQ|nr:Putative serine esterase (DUF676), putative [Trypanosoma equiperdum]